MDYELQMLTLLGTNDL